MRHLSRTQKKALDGWYAQAEKPIGVSFDAENLPYEVYAKIVSMNNFETINAEITRYLQELEEGAE